jgi:Family of unknown function (DUF6488)
MRILTLVLTVFMGMAPLSAMAGPGHGHSHGPVEITKAQAEKIASYRVAEMVLAKEIQENWASILPASAEKNRVGDGLQWVVSYKDDQATDPEKAQLVVFLSSAGEFITSNFTGE